ncbi:MAG: hypothetical protein IPQ28_13435 [Sphingobacteriales bacterium]|nr:hypothetical protein [Sphingobacteriales bacterium]
MAKKSDKPAKRNKVSAKIPKPTVKIVQETIENTNIAGERLFQACYWQITILTKMAILHGNLLQKYLSPDADGAATKLSTKRKGYEKSWYFYKKQPLQSPNQ